jgi:GT2 family glycosyltransferase
MLNEKDLLNEELADKENIISEQNRKIHTLYQQVDALNTKLSEIHASEGWKLLSVYYRIRDGLLPMGSPRYRRVKKLVNLLRGKKDDDLPVGDHYGPDAGAWIEPTIFDPFSFPDFSRPRVSIIIPAYNGWGINYQCLRSISENTEGVSYEVIFADDLSNDETQYVEKYIGNIVHVRNEKNLGFLENCNHAASLAKGEYLHFLNNDTKVTPGWLGSLLALMEKDPSIGMAGSKLVYPNGRLQEAGGIIWLDGSGWNYGHNQDPAHPMFNYVKDADYISGASVMIRTGLWREIGGFDTRYAPAYFEDTDLAFEVRKRGYRVVYQPLSQIKHFEGYSHGTEHNGPLKQDSVKKYQVENKIKFLEKWKDVLTRDHFPNGENVFWARDRSRGKKTILVIDHYVPQFDKDAGSRHTFQYLRLLVEMGMNVKFMGDNFNKHEPYTTALQQLGIEVLYGEYFRRGWKDWLVENRDKIDLIYFHRPHVTAKYIDFVKAHTKARILYFGHDLHFYREEKQYEIEKKEEILGSARAWKQTELSIFEKADLVITPSEIERQIIAGLPGSFRVATLPLFYFKTTNDPITNFQNRKDIIFVGGFNHKPNLDGVLWFVREIWPLIKARVSDIKFIIVGSNVPDELKMLKRPDLIIKGYVSDTELGNLYNQIRLAVIPLRYGAGVKGKLLEAMHNGIPIVTTPDGIEGLPEDILFIKPVNDAPSFAAQVITLYQSNAALETLSAGEVSFMQKNFSYAHARSVFSEILSTDR